jgi:hypothetical protein
MNLKMIHEYVEKNESLDLIYVVHMLVPDPNIYPKLDLRAFHELKDFSQSLLHI